MSLLKYKYILSEKAFSEKGVKERIAAEICTDIFN